MFNTKKTIKAEITFKITEEHPDAQYVEDITKELSFEDTYTVDNEIDNEVVNQFIRNDLMLVAGGGYDTKHLINPKFYFNGKRVY